MFKEPIEYLRHIYDECKYILSTIQAETEMSVFIKDETLKRAIVRSLEIIGEASKKIPAEFKLQSKNIHWKNMAGIRDRLIHDYMSINYFIVWDVIRNKIPELTKEIEALIKNEENKNLQGNEGNRD